MLLVNILVSTYLLHCPDLSKCIIFGKFYQAVTQARSSGGEKVHLIACLLVVVIFVIFVYYVAAYLKLISALW